MIKTPSPQKTGALRGVYARAGVQCTSSWIHCPQSTQSLLLSSSCCATVSKRAPATRRSRGLRAPNLFFGTGLGFPRTDTCAAPLLPLDSSLRVAAVSRRSLAVTRSTTAPLSLETERSGSKGPLRWLAKAMSRSSGCAACARGADAVWECEGHAARTRGETWPGAGGGRASSRPSIRPRSSKKARSPLSETRA